MAADGAATNGLAAKVATQHRLIEMLFRSLDGALSGGDAAAARTRADGLGEALAAHFRLEEDHYFPARREASPDTAEGLAELVSEHGLMLAEVEVISRHLDAGTPGRAAESLRALVSRFHGHEEREQAMLGA